MHFNKYICSVLILFLFFTNQIQAQATFNKTIDFSNGDDVGFGIVKLNDGYILIGNGWGYEIGEYFDEKIKYAKIDFEGNLLWQKVLGSVDSQYYSYFIAGQLLTDGNIVFAGSKAADGLSNVLLVKFNPNTGDTIFTKTYFSEQWQTGMQVFEFSNGDLLLFCAGGASVFYRTILKKTDADGNLLWSKLIGDFGEYNSTVMGPIDSENIFYLLHAFIDCPTPKYEIRKFDSAGTILTEEIHEGGCFTNGIKSIVGGYYGGGINKPDYPYNSLVFRLDDSDELLWIFNSTYDIDTIYDNFLQLSVGFEYPNGDLLVIGYLATEPVGDYHGYIARVDINGNAIWERRYLSPGGLGQDNRIHDIELTDAGGIIIAGAAYGEVYAEDQNFWVMQLDSVGCLVPGCDSLDVSILPMPFNNDFIVFPNPANEYCVIQTGTPLKSNTSIELFSTNGALIKTYQINAGNISATLTLENIPAGMYFIKVQNEDDVNVVLKLMVNN
ncbi:MAG: T9SS type A sorting domain-containing protein [Chitinophagales bacterium]|nr:T9SS type A sorting domain-containing protein [Chitinophagales bacterium]MBP9190770.1 T9SS type A sorting domain-containing protein [Chitinophagales bacterium]MBP9704077.1 T9SS type A sorting domain-containing protein [Chitinophagales bacterium]